MLGDKYPTLYFVFRPTKLTKNNSCAAGPVVSPLRIDSETFSDEDIPSVVVLGPAERCVTRGRSTALRMVATPPACGEDT